MPRTILILLLLVLAVTPPARAQYGSAVNGVTVNVNAITQIRVIGGAVGFNITDAIVVAGQNTMTLTNSATQLQWATNSGSRKITVQTNLGSQLFALRLLATSPTQGSSSPEVTVSTIPTDHMLNIGRTLGSCTLLYTAEALATQGTGTDIHTITFTVTVQ
ncbi:MAG: hypothetical protein AABY75_00765 [Bacteroidota bacterium]